MSILTEIKDRVVAETPTFWKKIQIAGAVIGGIGALIVAAPVSLPSAIVATGTYLITIGTTITGISQLTKK